MLSLLCLTCIRLLYAGTLFALVVQTQEPRDHFTLPTSRRDEINKAVLQKELRTLEALRQLFADGLFNDTRTGKTDHCTRLRHDDVAVHGKARRHAARCGVGQHSEIKEPCIAVQAYRALVFAICIKDKMPSCILAPPAAVKPITDRRCSVAYSNKRVIFSPTTVPMLPIIKCGSMQNTAQSSPITFAVPQTTASFSRVARRALFSLFS